jgi:hypothetical protein
VRRVLVAGTQDVIDVARAALGEAVRAALGGELELATAYSVSEALRQVEGGVELVLCNVRFDDSRMFDFLGALNAMPQAGPPVICCRVARGPMSAGARRGIELALEALGVVAFLDMYELESRDGPSGAHAALREAVMTRLRKE